jgi:hypothetical protein
VKCTLSSPVIRGNTITRNSLGDPSTAPFDPGQGAGVALVGSHALVSSNTISDNEVLNHSSAGGGVYIEWSVPDLWFNTISGNRAPEGAAVFATVSRPMLFNNLISQNENYYYPPVYSGSVYGAVVLDQCWDQDVDFNYFVANVGSAGGAMYVNQPYRGSVANNLFIGNYAWNRQNATGGEGGGIWLMTRTDPPETFEIVGNTFSGNYATNIMFGEMGGAIAVLPLSASALVANNVMAFNTSGIYQRAGFSYHPTLVGNDMYNSGHEYINLPAGPTDMIADPAFVDRAHGNYRLLPTSPAVDAGDPSCPAMATDIDGAPRVQDGNDDGTARVDVGAYEYSPDFDHDGIADWQDPDDDDDGVADVSDCAPRNASAWSVPVEVDGLGVSGSSPTTVSWSTQDPGAVYDVVRGALAEMRADRDFARASCGQDDMAGGSWNDAAPDPAPGTGLYYLVRAQSVCGDGGWGGGSGGARVVAACP